MQYLCNQWSDFKNSWSFLIMTVLWIERYTMYPLHLNYAATLPRKTITMKITIFIIVLVLKSNETWKLDISDCHSLFEHVFKVFSVQLPVLLGVFRRDRAISQSLLTQMSGFSIYRPRKLYPWLLKSINNRIYLICFKLEKYKQLNNYDVTSLQ